MDPAWVGSLKLRTSLVTLVAIASTIQFVPPSGQTNLSPTAGNHFFGDVEVSRFGFRVTMRDNQRDGSLHPTSLAGIHITYCVRRV